ncbi:spore cortex-lytic enzyme [Paenibacillus sp. BIHB 4019]|uniref:Spore cortex-lytic enzyme n=1 Tax=Paenibacillus sp. BIHB 4019 TaxID=1870819 RepID=A0A1B2DND2_9BACL|nr:cell wall hydrolase [Paenibacillus sp. BIHB 4019]ANY69201.1 spore cortex-lytic enzyme [Paenibacillus sp. BIHB 4019]
MKNNRIFRNCLAYIFAIFLVVSLPLQIAGAAAPATLSYGSKGEDVPDVQYRLKILGYFMNAEVTDFYGKMTEDAVKRFQKDYGLQADGIAGKQTWKTLKKVTVSEHELNLLARIIFAESRGEPFKGQVAVGAVVMNRLASSQFPDTLKGVIEQPGAFTAVDDGQYKLQPDSTAYKAAVEAIAGNDPSNGALYYFNPKTATSSWIWTREQLIQIGNHIFAI